MMKMNFMRMTLALLLIVGMGAGEVWSAKLTVGMAGFDVRWEWDEDTQTLTFSGTGGMANFSFTTPWDWLKSSVRTVVIERGVTGVGSHARLNHDLSRGVDTADVADCPLSESSRTK